VSLRVGEMHPGVVRDPAVLRAWIEEMSPCGDVDNSLSIAAMPKLG